MPWIERAFFLIAVGIAFTLFVKNVWIFSSASLWHDEITTISRFSQKGFMTTWTYYPVPNNHILFNLLNVIWPADLAYEPVYARFFSFIATFCSFSLLAWFAWQERAFLTGAIALVLLSTNLHSLDLILQARGYGLAMFAAVLLSVAAHQYLTTNERRWLIAAAIGGFIGTAALPIFLILSAPMMISLFLLTRRLEVLAVSLITAVAGAVFYAPTARQIMNSASEFSNRFGVHYTGLESVWESLAYLIPAGPIGIAFAVFLGVVILFSLIQSPRPTRRFLFAAVASLFTFFTVCLILSTPLIRTTQFTTGVLAVLIIVSVGPMTSNTVAKMKIGPGILAAWVALLAFTGIRQTAQAEFIPIEDWAGSAKLIEAIRPNASLAYVPYRAHLLGPYLSKDIKFDTEHFDRAKFGEGTMIAVDANRKRGDRFTGTDFFPEAIDVRLWHRNKKYQIISFVPFPTGALSFRGGKKADRDVNSALGLDGIAATSWQFQSPDSRDGAPVRLAFNIDQPRGCERFFLYAKDDTLPQTASVRVTDNGVTVKLADSALERFDELLIVDLGRSTPERIILKAPTNKTRGTRSINEAWCEAAGGRSLYIPHAQGT